MRNGLFNYFCTNQQTMVKINWQGVYPALTTKMKEDASLDLPAFQKHLDTQIQEGIHGAIIGGSLGEASTLKPDEIITLLLAAKETAGERIPVLVNIAEASTDDAVHAARAAESNGADGLMLLPPMRYKADDHETVVYFKTVAENTSLPIMIYNNPYDYKIAVTIEMFEQLTLYPNIEAVKESSRDITNVTRMINAFGNRFKILGGVDTLALECLAAGADGWVAGLVNAFPAETVAIYQLIKKGHLEEALAIYRWFMPLLELDIHAKLVQYIKLAEAAAGLGTEHVRPPRLKLTGVERVQILTIINDALQSRPNLKIFET